MSHPIDTGSPDHHALMAQYFQRHLHILPQAYVSLDTNRITLMYFALAGMHIMGKLNEFLDEKDHRVCLIKWIYAQQILPDSKNHFTRCGFRGSPAAASSLNGSSCGTVSSNEYDEGSLSQTYTALCCLILLGDHLETVHREAIISSLKHLQGDDGNFRACYSGGEADLRFVYCACAVSELLNDWSGLDCQRTVDFIRSCRRYDGGYALQPDGEAHGGSTYLAVASLSLLGELSSIDNRDSLVHWCMMNQGNGYRGRPNKPPDSCYAFWLGAVNRLIGAEHMTHANSNSSFLEKCAHLQYGGFSKHEGGYPDLMHSYMALAGLSIIDEITQTSSNNEPLWMNWCLSRLDVRLGLPQDMVPNKTERND